MAALNSKSIYHLIAARVLARGALAVCLTANPLVAQNIIGGNFTLNENTRFGSTILRAGQYNFSIEPIGTIQSMRTIQQGAGHLVLVVLKPAKSGPTASMFAMASPSDHAREASELVLEPETTEPLARIMYLEKEGLMVDFHWWSAKAQTPVAALKIAPQQFGAEARTGRN